VQKILKDLSRFVTEAKGTNPDYYARCTFNKTFYSKTLHFVEKYTYIVHVATEINLCLTLDIIYRISEEF